MTRTNADENGLNLARDFVEHLTRSNGWAAGRGPLYQRLSEALQAAIERGDVTPGMRLPAERLLAEGIGVSRSTVVAAYERLQQRGLVERRQGSGTRISPRAVARASQAREAELVEAFDRNVLFRGVIEGVDGGDIDLLGACLPGTERLSPALLATAGRELAVATAHDGYFPAGYPPLRRAIAEYLTSGGLPTTEAHVLVTNGAQQAFSLAASFFVQRGERVALENPTYPGAIDAATAVGAQLVSLPVGVEGVQVNTLREALVAASPKLVYLNPTFHNPTGTVMPDAARAEVAWLVSKSQVVLIEDRAVAELALEGEAPWPIAVHAPEAPILTVGSMSKLFWGGLRVGWIRAPEPLIARLTRFKAVLDLGTSLPGQVTARLLLEELAEVRRERRREISARFRLLGELLSELLPSWSWTQPKGGLSLWVRLPFGSAREFAAQARRRGVMTLPGTVMSPDSSFDTHLRLTAARSPDVLTEGIQRLAASWEEFALTAKGSRGQIAVIV